MSHLLTDSSNTAIGVAALHLNVFALPPLAAARVAPQLCAIRRSLTHATPPAGPPGDVLQQTCALLI